MMRRTIPGTLLALAVCASAPRAHTLPDIRAGLRRGHGAVRSYQADVNWMEVQSAAC